MLITSQMEPIEQYWIIKALLYILRLLVSIRLQLHYTECSFQQEIRKYIYNAG